MFGDKFKNKIQPKKSLGQHFLRSEKALIQMVESAGDEKSPVVEIGPGEGVLTEKLLQKGFSVLAVELDRRAIEILDKKFEKEIGEKRLKILEKDCLEVDFVGEVREMGGGAVHFGAAAHYILLGNIPYYITGAIFRNAFEQKILPDKIIFLIQKEVAQRIVATDKKESLLSVSVKIFSESVEIVDIVKAGSFVPPPKVDSAILKISDIAQVFLDKNHYNRFFQILKSAFSHKRKFLLSNLKTDLDEKLLEKYFTQILEIIPEKSRAEDISLETWRKVLEICKN